MTGPNGPTIHASAVLVGARALLIRGPAGAGKSRLALSLLQADDGNLLPFTRLVADDRAHVAASHGRLLVSPAPALAGMIEVRGLGIRTVPFEPLAVVGMIIDLAAAETKRLPDHPEDRTVVEGIALPRLAIAPGIDPLPAVLAVIQTKALPA